MRLTRELYEFRDLIADGCLDILQPDAACVGGITGLRRVATMAQEHGVGFTPHTWGNGLGLVANAHLTAGLVDAPFLEFPYDPPEWDLDRRDYMMAEPCRIDADGFVVLPEFARHGLRAGRGRAGGVRGSDELAGAELPPTRRCAHPPHEGEGKRRTFPSPSWGGWPEGPGGGPAAP